MAGAFEPISTMTEARDHATRVSPAVAWIIHWSRSAAEESLLAATAAGRERREVPCGHFGAPPGRSCGSPDHRSGATRFECWWPLARGNPASSGSSRGPLGPVDGRSTSTARADHKARTCDDGRRKFLPVMHRAGSFAPRHVKGGNLGSSTRVRPASGGNRFGMNGQEGADPSDGERLPTRSKPSEGGALAGRQTSSESTSVDDDGLF